MRGKKKRAERRRKDVRAEGRKEEQEEGQAGSTGCPAPTVTCSLLARYWIITGPAGPAHPDPKAATSSTQVSQIEVFTQAGF